MDDDLDPEQGEGDHHVPGDLLELYEVLEWQEALAGRGQTRFVNPFADAGTFISRAGWGARPPRGLTRLANPPGVTWHYEGPRMGTFPHSSCATKVRGIQAFHQGTRGWTDIAYNHVVCPHGVVFEGRGRDVRSAANGTNAGNGSSHAVCALTGVGDPHPDTLFVGMLAARAHLMGGGTGPRTWGHRDWKATACPGDPIYRWHKAGDKPPAGAPPGPVPDTDPSPPEEDDMAEHADTLAQILATAEAGLAATREVVAAAERIEHRQAHLVQDQDGEAYGFPVYLITDGGDTRRWIPSWQWMSEGLVADFKLDPPAKWSRVHIDHVPLVGPEAPGVPGLPAPS